VVGPHLLHLQEAVPTLARMLALVGGDDELARLVVPLLKDALASQTAGAEAEVGGGSSPAANVHANGLQRPS
jgi:hypothetical protein